MHKALLYLCDGSNQGTSGTQDADLLSEYAPYYSYELERLASFPLVFYRRIWSLRRGTS